jgi:hypothetical protein
VEREACRFGPDRRLTALTATLTAIAVLGCLLSDDRPGRLLLGCAAALLAAYTVTDLAYAPRLEASASGLLIRAPSGTAHYPWSEVTAVRADTRQRLGLRSTTLEVDAGERLHVFSKRALGCDPERVAAQISALRPGG